MKGYAMGDRLSRIGPLLIAIAVSALSGCAGPDIGPKKIEQRVWPAMPDQPRFAFEATLQTQANIIPEPEDQRLQRMITGMAPNTRAGKLIGKPSGIAVRKGRIYVAEPGMKTVTVLDAARGKMFRFGLRPPNTLERPQALALDEEGLVYVLDPILRKVMVFDDFGLFRFSIETGAGFTNPVAVAVSPDGKTIYVVDRGDLGNEDHKVVAFNPDGTEKFRIGPRGVTDGRFNIPLAATVTVDGTLLVADSGNARIQAFSPDGKFKLSFGTFGSELGRFVRPRSIAADHDGNIYVADGGFNNVQIFNDKGQLLMPLGRLSSVPGPGNYALIGVIAVDESNRLYITDNLFRKIDVFRRLSDEEGKLMMIKSGNLPTATTGQENDSPKDAPPKDMPSKDVPASQL
jgi:DNA-binding beta-propeller fold protein YncE